MIRTAVVSRTRAIVLFLAGLTTLGLGSVTARSYFAEDCLGWMSLSGLQRLDVRTDRGVLEVEVIRYPERSDLNDTWIRTPLGGWGCNSVKAGGRDLLPARCEYRSLTQWGTPLIAFQSKHRNEFQLRGIQVSLWALLLMAIATILFGVEPVAIRNARKRRGECPTCGYDLRRLRLERCPECGRSSCFTGALRQRV
jgi:hypothetical protein